MPIASYQSQTAALAELQAALSDEARLLDLCLTFRRKLTGEVILTVGGRWDRTAKAYTDGEPQAIAISVNENQVRAVRRFAAWLGARIDDTDRKRILALGGNRRGGKSWIVTAMAVAVCVAIPDAIVWIVSPTLEKRDELERYVKAHAPESWRRYLSRELRFVFPNGASIKNVTGDDAEAIKRGEADFIVLNEPQQMSQDVFENGAPAVIDCGGLVVLAGNPARKRKGVWFTRLVKLLDEKPEWQSIGDFVRLDARDNPDIDKRARDDIGRLLREMNPEAARADDEGVFMEPGSFAYAEHFDDKRNTAPRLDVGNIVTSQIIRRGGVFGPYDVLCGADFQQWPGNAGVEVVAVGELNRPTWYVTRSLMREGDEDYFLDDAFGLWDQPRTLWIGDSSGTWQDAAHTKGRNSFDKFKARRWRIEPPRVKRSDRGEHPANPPREDRINLVNRLLDDGRLIVCLDGAKDVAEALAKCEIDPKGKPRGKYAHLTDALGYALWWATPQPKAASAGVPLSSSMHAVSIRPKGPRIV
jgi:hypothetical protein